MDTLETAQLDAVRSCAVQQAITDSNNWYAVVVQAKTPPPFIDKLNAALRTALTTEPVRGKLISAGAVPDPSTPEEMAEVMKRDTAKFAKVIQDKGIKAE